MTPHANYNALQISSHARIPYRDLNDLIQLCIKVDFFRKESSQKQSSCSLPYDKGEFQRGVEHIKETSPKPSHNLSKYEHISQT